jgi:hypothetical protein
MPKPCPNDLPAMPSPHGLLSSLSSRLAPPHVFWRSGRNSSNCDWTGRPTRCTAHCTRDGQVLRVLQPHRIALGLHEQHELTRPFIPPSIPERSFRS